MDPTDAQPKPYLYAQLNAFNIILESEPGKRYLELFGRGTTLKEIDSAFRLGEISPYDVDEEGMNYCVVVSILLLLRTEYS